MSETTEILKRIRLFEGLDEEELQRFAGRFTRQVVPAGTPVLQQGFASSTLFVLLEGKVKVLRRIGDSPVLIAELDPLQIFGELGIVDGEPASATVMAEGEIQILSMPSEEFEGLLQASTALEAKIWKNLAREIARRIRTTTDQVQDAFAINQALCENDSFRQFYKLYGP